jgi:hypothetical protein
MDIIVARGTRPRLRAWVEEKTGEASGVGEEFPDPACFSGGHACYIQEVTLFDYTLLEKPDKIC